MRRFCALAMATALLGSASFAATVPFVEDFNSSAAGWTDAVFAPAAWQAAGGPDGGAHVQTTFNFVNSSTGAFAALLRGEDPVNTSGGAFFGNYTTDGVTEFRVDIRHDAPFPLNFFTRFATPTPGFAAIAVDFAPILPHTWTTVSIPIVDGNPQFISYSAASSFSDIFVDRSINRVQIGLEVPADLAGFDAPLTFSFDKLTLLPEPTAALSLLAGLALLRRRG